MKFLTKEDIRKMREDILAYDFSNMQGDRLQFLRDINLLISLIGFGMSTVLIFIKVTQ